jgi:hypothetical protein
VCAQQAVKVRDVQLKVEMLLALVSKVEHLVSSAETAARTLQVSSASGSSRTISVQACSCAVYPERMSSAAACAVLLGVVPANTAVLLSDGQKETAPGHDTSQLTS